MGSKREGIFRKGVLYWVRRSLKTGRFMKWVRADRSLSRDVRQRAKRIVRSGQGDRGDQRRRK